jgi:hemerythrin
MPIVDLDAIPTVALTFMNEDHREEGRLLNDAVDALEALRAGRAAPPAVLGALEALLAHTREHFEREEATMRDARFPPYPVHKAEHDHVVGELEIEIRRFRETGETGRLRAYLTEAVPRWFVAHIESMDTVTARFVASRQQIASL